MEMASELGRAVEELAPDLIALRRELHQHPELAFEERWTAATLAARMRSLGLGVEEGIGGTGVLAMLQGAMPGRTLLIRADMDALPMDDLSSGGYASRLANRNHSCGHDVHAAVVAGVAEVLARYRRAIAGRVAFVFQPADEPMRGARRMIEEGLLDRARPDMSLGLHVLPMIRAGQVVVQRGPIWASWDTRIYRMSGPPASGDASAGPDVTRVAAQVTVALYDLVAREGRSAEPVTFRVRSLQAEQPGRGTRSEAAIEVLLGRGEPSVACLEINLALYDNALRLRLLDRIEEVAGGMAAAAGGVLSSDTDYALPALVNDDHVTGAVERAARAVVGPDNIVMNWRNRFSDDFGLLMAEAPGCLLLLGTANPDKGITESWHRPRFDVDEDALPVGVRIMAQAALDLLR
jgi:amidohydrolase